MRILAAIICLIIIASCTSLRSGQYVKLSKNDSLAKISKEYQVPTWAIEEANIGKKFIDGEWVFIPLKRGIMASLNSRVPGSTSGYVESGEFLWPVPSSRKVSSGYGRRWGRPHEGIDIPAKKGSHILAANDGVVVYSGSAFGGYGKITVISHRYGFFTVYAHAKKNYTLEGQKVYRGQVIALVGSTGRSSGSHLHFEIRRDGRSMNPIGYLKQ